MDIKRIETIKDFLLSHKDVVSCINIGDSGYDEAKAMLEDHGLQCFGFDEVTNFVFVGEK